jgi:hypothetical protein
MNLHTNLALLALLAAVTACSGSDGKGENTGNTQVDGTWSRLVEGSWTLGPGEEKTNYCVKTQVTEDTYVSAIRPIHPPGTHHTVVTLGDANSTCGQGAVLGGMVYAAGIGSPGLTLPPGVAMKIPAGSYVIVGLHIYNTGDTPLSGTSAIEIQKMNASDVQYESEAVLAGTVMLGITPGQSVQTGTCSVKAPQTMYALFPHMHQYGTHLKTTFTIGGTDTVVHDDAYDFTEQYQIPFAPTIALNAGDSIRTDCTYDNTTNQTITFGESSDTEMCFSILFRYPKQNEGLCIR